MCIIRSLVLLVAVGVMVWVLPFTLGQQGEGTKPPDAAPAPSAASPVEDPPVPPPPAPPQNPQTLQEFRTAGDAALRDNDHDTAIKMFTQAISLDDSEGSSFYKRATAYLMKGKNLEALSDLDAVLAHKSDNFQALMRRGKVLLGLGRVEDSRADYMEALKLKPGHDAATKQLGAVDAVMGHMTAARTAKNCHGAMVHLDAWIDAASECIEARLKRAECRLAAGMFNDVVEDTMRVLKVQSNSIKAYLLRGKALYRLGQNEAAVNHFKEGLRFDPEHKECKAEFKKVKKMDKSQREGSELFNQGKYEEAIEQFLIGTVTDPSNILMVPPLFLQLCKSYLKLNKADEAITYCTKSLELSESVDALSSRAEAHSSLGEYEKAIHDYNKALQMEPRNRNLNEGLEKVKRQQKIALRKDYYKILGVPKNAQMVEIRKAHRKLALEWHPDKHSENKEYAEMKYVEISEAYEVLQDDEKRARYDNGEDIEVGGHGHQGFHGGGPFGSHFSFNFGRR